MMPDLFRRLKPLYPDAIERLWIEYQLGDPERQREINEVLLVLAIKHLGMMVGEERLILEAPPTALIARGEITIGHVVYPGILPYPVRIGRDELLRHVFILGPTGTGKSTLLLGLLTQLLHCVPVMIFDFKRNYRCLLAKHHVVVFTVGRTSAPLHLNALRPPPGVLFDEWAGALADIIGTSYLLMQGARNVLANALLEARRQRGEQATLRDARDLIAAALNVTRSGSRRYGWLESTDRTLDELTKAGFGDALNDPHGTPIEDLLCESIVFELHGFGEDQKRAFCLLFLQAVLLLRKNSAMPRERLQHVLVFDEAHNVFPREKFGEQSVPARLAREVREYGEALIAATQQADVSESLIANSGFKFILRCDYPKDVTFASQLLQIEPKWLPRLALGTGIARFPVRYYLPLLFTFPEQPIKSTVISDHVVRAAWLASTLSRLHAPTQPMNDREHALLVDVARTPISTITQRYERLGWNYKIGNTIKDAVIAKGFATFEAVPTPTGQVKILSLTDRACDLLARASITITRPRGGPAHEYWKYVIAERLRHQGFTVSLEYAVGDSKRVDVHAVTGERTLFVEIETGRSDIIANATKCATLTGTVWFVFTDARVREEHAPALRAILPSARLITTAELHELR